MPVEAVLLLTIVQDVAEKLLEHIEVNFPLGERLREQVPHMFQILGDDIRRACFGVAGEDLVHGMSFRSQSRACRVSVGAQARELQVRLDAAGNLFLPADGGANLRDPVVQTAALP